MRNETIEIKFWYIVVFIIAIFIVYAFSSGWECGFLGYCARGIKIWQGIARLFLLALFITLFIVFIIRGIAEEWSFKIRNPFYNEADQEAWEEYQRWLKERK